MKTIVVDDEAIMLKSFRRLSEGVEGIDIAGMFGAPEEALEYARSQSVDLAILDISMPGMTGIELAEKLRQIRKDMLIVFITAYDQYVRESNQIGADYYIVKPYKRDVIEQMAERMRLLSRRLRKDVYITTFGRFVVYKGGQPVPLRGKTKEILALVVSSKGKEISNEEIYSTIWPGRPYGNREMKVYYNALKRLRDNLEEYGLSDLLISTSRGQLLNTDVCDCDYLAWLSKTSDERSRFDGEFMSEYSWGEFMLPELMNEE